MELSALLITFGTIFLVELPDKTFLATLVLSTRYRPLLVWLGVGLAFTVQTGVAVLLGRAVSFLPDDLVRGLAAVMFLVGAALLAREARQARADHTGQADAEASEGADILERAAPATGWRAVLASFLVLFAAEWGDLSQLLTITLVARFDAVLPVFVGALAALLTVSALAVLVGRALTRRVPVHVLMWGGAMVCLALASLTTYELLA
ncbi:TMEM165/GDT1 family protein [Nocardioides salarius]|uniref:TMEM165/GDT1 family protein n=1 Tax=Nocardioides salarius TaxID=374513 RepID=UPI0030F6BC44